MIGTYKVLAVLKGRTTPNWGTLVVHAVAGQFRADFSNTDRGTLAPSVKEAIEAYLTKHGHKLVSCEPL